jgi:hypothetical protein
MGWGFYAVFDFYWKIPYKASTPLSLTPQGQFLRLPKTSFKRVRLSGVEASLDLTILYLHLVLDKKSQD